MMDPSLKVSERHDEPRDDVLQAYALAVVGVNLLDKVVVSYTRTAEVEALRRARRLLCDAQLALAEFVGMRERM